MTTEVVIEAIESLGPRREAAELFGVTEVAIGQWINDAFPPARTLELYNHCNRAYDLAELLAK
jgi:hypothetical protein